MIHKKKIATQTFIGQDKICLSFVHQNHQNSNQINCCDGHILYSDNTSTKMMHDPHSYLISLCFLMLILSLPERFIFLLFLTNSCHAFRILTRIFFLRQILASFIFFFFFCITSHWTFQIKRDMKDFSRCKDDTKCLNALYLQNYTLKWCFNRNLIILTNACELTLRRPMDVCDWFDSSRLMRAPFLCRIYRRIYLLVDWSKWLTVIFAHW